MEKEALRKQAEALLRSQGYSEEQIKQMLPPEIEGKQLEGIDETPWYNPSAIIAK